MRAKAAAITSALELARGLSLTPSEAEKVGITVNRDGVRRSAFDLLAYPEVTLERLAAIWPELGAIGRDVAEQVEIDAKYAVYMRRQESDIGELRREEAVELPPDLAFAEIAGLSNEIRQKLVAVGPRTPRAGGTDRRDDTGGVDAAVGACAQRSPFGRRGRRFRVSDGGGPMMRSIDSEMQR